MKRHVSTVPAYAEAFQVGDPVQAAGLCGRIIRGKRPSDFTTLTDDPDRKLVMLMGADGLSMLPGRTGYDMLTAIGYTERHIADKVRTGNQFKLAIFPESRTARPATWDNMLAMAGQVYPAIARDLERHRAELKRTPFGKIEQSASFRFADVDAAGKDHPDFMTLERYLDSPRDLAAARAFLYFTVHLRELYSGDGYTYTHDGKRGLQEYVVPNRPISQLGQSALLDISVQLP